MILSWNVWRILFSNQGKVFVLNQDFSCFRVVISTSSICEQPKVLINIMLLVSGWGFCIGLLIYRESSPFWWPIKIRETLVNTAALLVILHSCTTRRLIPCKIS
jgi:hypothetical protein